MASVPQTPTNPGARLGPRRVNLPVGNKNGALYFTPQPAERSRALPTPDRVEAIGREPHLVTPSAAVPSLAACDSIALLVNAKYLSCMDSTQFPSIGCKARIAVPAISQKFGIQ